MSFKVVRRGDSPMVDMAFTAYTRWRMGRRQIPIAAVYQPVRGRRRRQYERGIDYAADGSLVGYEFMNASRGIDLGGLPHRAELETLLERTRGLKVFRRVSHEPTDYLTTATVTGYDASMLRSS